MRIPETGDYLVFKEAVLALPFTLRDEHVSEEKGLVLHDGSAELEWVPMRPGTVRGTIDTSAHWEDGVRLFSRKGGPCFVHDDGDGNLIVEGRLAGTLNYISGKMQLNDALFQHSEYLLEYFYDAGHAMRIPTMLLKAPTAPVVRQKGQEWLECPF